MARRGGEPFQKRQREQARRERSKMKALRKEERAAEEGEEEPVDEAALMEQFRILNEKKEAGAIEDEDFELQRDEIYEKLGIDMG